MATFDLVLLHPPSVYDFRTKSLSFGPISDVVPSTPVFEMYPIGFISLLKYLRSLNFKVRLVNLASKMLSDSYFNVESFLKHLNSQAFGIDLHWLVHAHGSLEIAKIIKEYHPEKPVILGGLSATYYHKEIIEKHSQIDYVVRGDSAEIPFLKLMECIDKGIPPKEVPNITWRTNTSKIQVNSLSHVPDTLETFDLDYGEIVKSVLRSLDLTGHIPSKAWLEYPITAILTCKGCLYNCVTCGGSRSSYKLLCRRTKPAFKSPEKIVEEIKIIEQYLDAPIFLIGDLRQGGNKYAHQVLKYLRNAKIRNPVVFEIFIQASKSYLRKMARASDIQNLQISPESHDEKVRRFQGRPYSNHELEETISNSLNLGFKKIDVFFMIGLPGQNCESVQDTIKYCNNLLEKYGKDLKLHPFIAPLAPFLDPGSPAFENPTKYGYIKLYQSLNDHKESLTAPSWKYFLNYKTSWLNRDDIVNMTYTAASSLNEVKSRFGLIEKEESFELIRRIKFAREITEKVVNIIESTTDNTKRNKALKKLTDSLQTPIEELLCPKNELKVPHKTRIRKLGVIRTFLGI